MAEGQGPRTRTDTIPGPDTAMPTADVQRPGTRVSCPPHLRYIIPVLGLCILIFLVPLFYRSDEDSALNTEDHIAQSKEGQEYARIEDRVKMLRGELYKKVKKYKKPLNILIIGGAGAGKSSFVNSAIRAITKRTGYWATVGQGKLQGKITATLHRYNLYFPEVGIDGIKTEHTPRATDGGPLTPAESPQIIDVCGLPDENTALLRMVLRLLLYGHIPDDDNVLDVLINAYSHNPATLIENYPEADKALAIDRVIVAANADANVPWELLKAIIDVAQPTSHYRDGAVSKRGVPVFGLLTKVDLVEKPDGSLHSEATRRKDDLIQLLCLTGAAEKFGMCKNYISNDDDDMKKNNPDIDERILKFMCNIMEPSHRVSNSEWKLQRDSIFRGLWAMLRLWEPYILIPSILTVLMGLVTLIRRN